MHGKVSGFSPKLGYTNAHIKSILPSPAKCSDLPIVHPFTCVFQEFASRSSLYTVLRSSSIAELALKAGGTSFSAVKASEQDYTSSSYTCVTFDDTTLSELRQFDTLHGKRWLDAVPLSSRTPIFKGFMADGFTPETKGDQCRMTSSADMARKPNKILASIAGEAKKACAAAVSLLT